MKNSRVKLGLDQINWKAINVGAVLWFLSVSITASKVAYEAGERSLSQLAFIGVAAGVMGALANSSGVMTQRTVGKDGTASWLPSLSSTDTTVTDGEYPDEPDEPRTGGGSVAPAVPEEVIEIGRLALALARKEAEKEKARLAAIEATRVRLADLEAGK